jgi:sialate O-acetylesterase
MIRKSGRLLLLGLAASALGLSPEPRLDLKLHGLFGDGMVFQRETACPVWGTASPGASVSVSIAGQAKTAKAGPDGRWSLKLDPMKAGGPHEMKVNALVVKDVLVGEVWLAAGGSNMDMPVKTAQTALSDPDNDPFPMVRFFIAPRRQSEVLEKEIEGAWKNNRSEAVADVSAVGYFFAREMRRRLNVPVGFIQASFPDSVADAWISARGLQTTPGLREFTVPHALEKANYDTMMGRYLRSLHTAEEAKQRGEAVPPVIPKPIKPAGSSGLYNGMISPLLPFALKGAIFYQGEPESYRGPRYQLLLSALIKTWRAEWGEGDFPFGYVQLANLGSRDEEPLEQASLPKFRESQRLVLQQQPDTGMVVTIDLGDGRGDLPRNKEEVGRRLALWAENRAYGKTDLVYSGPLFDSYKIEFNKVRIKFKNLGGGLKVNGDVLKGFTLASDFRKFTWAHALVEGDTVVVWSDELPWPAAVRYAWADNPECNLFNKEGLPASPFRTDTW